MGDDCNDCMLEISRVSRTAGPQPMGQLVQLVPRACRSRGSEKGVPWVGCGQSRYFIGRLASREYHSCSQTQELELPTEAKGKCSFLCRSLCGNVAQGWTAKLRLGT